MNSKTSFIFTWEWSRARPQGRTPWACRGTCDPWTSWKASQWTGSQTPPWFPSLRTKNDQQRIQTQRWFSLTKQQECKFVYSPEKLNRRSYVLNSIAVLLFVDWLNLKLKTESEAKKDKKSDDEPCITAIRWLLTSAILSFVEVADHNCFQLCSQGLKIVIIIFIGTQ